LFQRSHCDLTYVTLDPNTYHPILISLHLAVNPPPKECNDEICHSIKPAQVRKTQHCSLRLCFIEFIGQRSTAAAQRFVRFDGYHHGADGVGNLQSQWH
jgi:hypothetical protein